MEYDKKMDHPSNGVSILGYLRPTFVDEETYFRKHFDCEDGDNNNSDWEGIYVAFDFLIVVIWLGCSARGEGGCQIR